MTERFEILGLGQVSRSVDDIGGSVDWYRDVLGLTHLFTFDKLAFFDCGGVRLMLSERDALQPAESMLYLRVADINRTVDALSERGVEFINAPHCIHRHEDGTEEWMAFFKDLEGRPFALMSQLAAKAT